MADRSEVGAYFLYFCDQIKNAGHIKVTKASTPPIRRATGVYIDMNGYTARLARVVVRATFTNRGARS